MSSAEVIHISQVPPSSRGRGRSKARKHVDQLVFENADKIKNLEGDQSVRLVVDLPIKMSSADSVVTKARRLVNDSLEHSGLKDGRKVQMYVNPTDNEDGSASVESFEAFIMVKSIGDTDD